MNAFRRCHRRFARALLALLVLGMVFSPIFAVAAQVHSLEHAAAADDLHQRAHLSDVAHHHHLGGQVDPDHATGTHGLMHQTVNVTVTLPDAVLRVLAQPVCTPSLPEVGCLHLPNDPTNLPFRPPIA